MAALGSDVCLAIRHDRALRYMDPMLQDRLIEALEGEGVDVQDPLHRRSASCATTT